MDLIAKAEAAEKVDEGKYSEDQIRQYMDYVKKDFGSKYTPDQMAEYEGYVRSNFGDTKAKKGLKSPLGSLENPQEYDLFGSDLARTKASFGDLEGVKPLLAGQGWTDVQKNAAGDLIAKKNGKYYRDANRFTKNPVNWLESKVGGALPVAGMALGGAAGGGAASIPLAGLGAAGGEGYRQVLGRAMGVYKGDPKAAATDLAMEGAGGAAAELGGKVIGRIPIPGTGLTIDKATALGLQKLVNSGARAATKTSRYLTGADEDAFLRQLMRPDEVKNALEPGNALRVSREAQAELEARARAEGEAISKARQQFAAEHHSTPIDTTDMKGDLAVTMVRNQPNAAGKSGMTEAELRELGDLANRDLSTVEVVRPEVRASKVEFKPEQSVLRDASGHPIESVRVNPGPEFTVQPAQTVSRPTQTAAELQKTADYLQQEIDASSRKIMPSNRTAKSQGAYMRLLGQLKDAFHKVSDPLKKADARFSDFAEKAKVLGPIENDATGESFAANLFGANKGARQEAAQALVPQSYEGMADIGAAKHLSRDARFSKYGPSAPAILRSGMSLGGGAAGFTMTGSLEGGLLGLGAGTALAVGTSPMVHKEVYYLAGKYGMPVVNALVRNPQLIPVLLDSEDARRAAAIWLRGGK